jgi:hypothetical protein
MHARVNVTQVAESGEALVPHEGTLLATNSTKVVLRGYTAEGNMEMLARAPCRILLGSYS